MVRALPTLERLEERSLLNAGELDVVFGSLGTVTTNFHLGTDQVHAVALQSDGRILAVGESGLTDSSFALARYNPGGSLDRSFGSGGLATQGFGAKNNGAARALLVQPDGKIVVAGVTGGTANHDFVLARFLPSGQPDSSFGQDGVAITDFGGDDELHSLALAPDGSIVAAGSTDDANGFLDSVFALARYTGSGQLDAGFGQGGKVTTKLGSFDAAINKVLIQPDGAIVVAGHSSTSGDFFNVALARYTATGALDAGFGQDGIVLTHVGFFDDARDLALQPDGKLVAVGVTNIDNKSLVTLVRVLGSGRLNQSFGQAGIVTTDFGGLDQAAQGVVIQPDGKLVVAGIYAPRGPSQFLLARYTSAGLLDTSFGQNGLTTTALDATQGSGAAGLSLLGDGRFVVAGSSAGKFALARYWGDQSPPSYAQGSPSAIFVATLYQETLGREVDQPGLDYWLGRLNAGASRTDVARAIASGGEYLSRQVDNLFGDILGRAADPGGRAFFVAGLSGGATLDDVRASLLTSDEFFQKAGGSNLGFLAAVYRKLLARGIDGGAAGFWQEQLAKQGRVAVVSQVAGTAEARLSTIDRLYQGVLNRPADDSRSYWLTIWQQGRREEDIFAALAGSDEFYGNL